VTAVCSGAPTRAQALLPGPPDPLLRLYLWLLYPKLDQHVGGGLRAARAGRGPPGGDDRPPVRDTVRQLLLCGGRAGHAQQGVVRLLENAIAWGAAAGRGRRRGTARWRLLVGDAHPCAHVLPSEGRICTLSPWSDGDLPLGTVPHHTHNSLIKLVRRESGRGRHCDMLDNEPQERKSLCSRPLDWEIDRCEGVRY